MVKAGRSIFGSCTGNWCVPLRTKWAGRLKCFRDRFKAH
jgi:hypothetical protein